MLVEGDSLKNDGSCSNFWNVPLKQQVITTENQKSASNSGQDDKSYNPRHLLESELTELSNEKAALENQVINIFIQIVYEGYLCLLNNCYSITAYSNPHVLSFG